MTARERFIPNQLKVDLAAGRTLVGTSLRICINPGIATLLSSVGIGFVEIDLNQAAFSTENMADVAVACRARGLPLIVRPPAAYAGVYGPFLEAGIWGLCVSDIENEQQARSLVRSTRFAPTGNRGTFEPGPHNDYYEGSEDLPWLNRELYVSVVFGTMRACAAADEILSLEGIDGVELDRVRLACELEGFYSNSVPEKLDEIEHKLLDVARRNGKATMSRAEDQQQLRRMFELGVNMVCYSSDDIVLHSGFLAAARRCRAMATREVRS